MSSNYLYKLSEKFLFSTKTNCPKKQQHCKGVYFSEKWILANYLFKECHPASKQSNENFPTDSCSPNDWVKKNSMSKGETLAWEMDCVNLTLYLCVFACLHFNCITENPNTYKSKKKKKSHNELHPTYPSCSFNKCQHMIEFSPLLPPPHWIILKPIPDNISLHPLNIYLYF